MSPKVRQAAQAVSDEIAKVLAKPELGMMDMLAALQSLMQALLDEF